MRVRGIHQTDSLVAFQQSLVHGLPDTRTACCWSGVVHRDVVELTENVVMNPALRQSILHIQGGAKNGTLATVSRKCHIYHKVM